QPFMSPRYPGGPRPPLRIPNQALGGVPGSQPLLPSGMDPTRQQGHPNMGGPMQRMTPPRGMVPLGPQVFSTDGGRGWFCVSSFIFCFRGPGGGRPWPNPTNANSIPYSSASPGNYVMWRGAPVCWLGAEHLHRGFPSAPGTDVGVHHQNRYQPAPNCPQCCLTSENILTADTFPLGPGSDGPMSGLGGMDSHHMNGSLG
ncbi:SSBP2 protein, partial [Aleadryas rufinucha]|nr:SSBP2 protein [Aleadryas rufinucha]